MTRTVARRFNDRYSPERPYFPEPEGLLSPAPLILGVDGAKMSKSRANAITLAASEDETARLVRAAKTDGERHVTYEPVRRPEVANLVLLAALCLDRQPAEVADEVGDSGAAGLKALVTEALNERLGPLRQRRQQLAGDLPYLRRVLAEGTEQARDIATGTLADVRRLMHNTY